MRPKLAEVKRLIEERFEANVLNNLRHNRTATQEQMRRAMMGDRDVRSCDGRYVFAFADPLNSLAYPVAKQIKENLFEIYEAL